VRFKIRVCLKHHLLRRTRDVQTQPGEELALLVDLALESLRGLGHLGLALFHQLPLPCLDPAKLVVQPFLQLLDVTGPFVSRCSTERCTSASCSAAGLASRSRSTTSRRRSSAMRRSSSASESASAR
jgi:hypothetical protein